MLVPKVTATDRDFAGRVAAEVGITKEDRPAFTGRMAKELREYGVLHAVGFPGRGLTVSYTDEDVTVAAAIERAKDDPDYRRKRPRAVLIAYGAGASVADRGLRRAYVDELSAIQDRALTVAHGGRLRETDGDDDYTIDEARAVAAMMSGQPVRGLDPAPGAVRAVAPKVTSDLRETMAALVKTAHATNGDMFEELRSLTASKPLGLDLAQPRGGMVEEGQLLNGLGTLLAAQAPLTVAIRAAREAPRAKLDEARSVVIGLRGVSPVLAAKSALETALSIPYLAVDPLRPASYVS